MATPLNGWHRYEWGGGASAILKYTFLLTYNASYSVLTGILRVRIKLERHEAGSRLNFPLRRGPGKVDLRHPLPPKPLRGEEAVASKI